MRVPGRQWRAGLLAACGLALVPVTFAAIIIGLAIDLGISPAQTSLGDAIKTGVVYTLFVVMFFLLAFGVGREALRGRIRYRQRQRALTTDIDALPLATVALPGGVALPDLAAHPLELLWERNPNNHTWSIIDKFAALLMVALSVFCGVLVVVMAFALLRSGEIHVIGFVALLGLSLFIFGAGGGMAWVYLRFMRPVTGHFGVIADAQGLTEVRRSVRSIAVPWDQMRLYEVEGRRTRFSHGARVTAYRVYGQQSVIAWAGFLVLGSELDPPLVEPVFRPVGTSLVEMALRYDQLTRAIVARTGLQPRTLSPALMHDAANTPRA